MIFQPSKERLLLALQIGNFGKLVSFAKITQYQLDSLNHHRSLVNQEWEPITSRLVTINSKTVRHVKSKRINSDKLTPDEIIYIVENTFLEESLIFHGVDDRFILENPNTIDLDGQLIKPRAIIQAGDHKKGIILKSIIPKGWQARKRKK